MSILQEGSSIGTYTVQHLIKENEYTETYKAVNKDNNPYFVKLYVLKRTPAKLIDEESHEVLEILVLQKLQNTNMVSYITHGTIDSPIGECQYVITNYFTGEVLSDKLAKKGKLDEDTAVRIFTGILNGLKCLHAERICHNDITPANIMISESLEGLPEIIDFGHSSSFCMGSVPFMTSDLDVRYCANATSAGIFNPATDIFSAFVVFYTMLAGNVPWDAEFDADCAFSVKISKMKQIRKNNPLDIAALKVSERSKYVLEKGLSGSRENSYESVDSILRDLQSSEVKEQKKSAPKKEGKSVFSQSSRRKDDELQPNVTFKKGSGNGFNDIAGMKDLKDMLEKKVIFVIQNKEVAEQYRLSPPNGLLLYGPPGCGKTFFAEKFAEQTSFNFMLIKSSDLASSYIHGTQQIIGKLFKQAEEMAPTVLCFDEFDAFVPVRNSRQDQGISSEVNEFLSQMNNCSQRGIFVIATTNRPDRIDPAILRTGRIDKHVFIPLPDKDARREMFALYLKGRPHEEKDINLDALANQTEGFIASDIAYIVNDAAMTAAFTRKVITQEMLEQAISETTPSINHDMIEMYDSLREWMDGVERKNMVSGTDSDSPIGFKIR